MNNDQNSANPKDGEVIFEKLRNVTDENEAIQDDPVIYASDLSAESMGLAEEQLIDLNSKHSIRIDDRELRNSEQDKRRLRARDIAMEFEPLDRRIIEMLFGLGIYYVNLSADQVAHNVGATIEHVQRVQKSFVKRMFPDLVDED